MPAHDVSQEKRDAAGRWTEGGAAAQKEHITKSPAFKAWFGNSKVVDEHGEPRVVYHGTNKSFDSFAHGQQPNNPYLNADDNGLGFFFDESPGGAERYAGGKSAMVMPAYLSMQSPYKVGYTEYIAMVKQAGTGAELQERLKALGYDGVIRMGPGSYEKKPWHFIVFSPNQIKSATGNKGTFDPNEDNINLSAAHDVSKEPRDERGRWTEGTDKGAQSLKAWFADSKIIDDNGNPRVVYHGSPNGDFEVFDKNKIGATDDGYYGRGFYFSPDQQEAQEYGSARPFYLKISHPFILPDAGTMGHDSLFDLRDKLASLKGGPDIATNRIIPNGYELRESEIENRYYNERNPNDTPTIKQYSIVPKPELYNTDQEIYGPDAHSPLAAIVEFNDAMADKYVRGGWAFGLLKDVMDRNQFHELLKENGYDGIIVADAEDDMKPKEFIAFEPGQIKLVKNANISLSSRQGTLWNEEEQILVHPRDAGGRWRPVTFFASGSNHAGEIHALELIPGANVGTVAGEVKTAERNQLHHFATTGRKVFIDSGAFTEVAFGQNGPHVVKPLTDKHWQAIFAVYADQALMHGENAFVVAPDMVAFQKESLERLAKYAEDVRDIFGLGATILVPIQKGSLSMAEYYRRADSILNAGDPEGGVTFRPSIPMKKDATSLEDLAAFCKEIKPKSIHLLGIAPDTERGKAAIQTVRDNAPDCDISCDACLIKRWVGRNNGPQGNPRLITALNDLHKEKLALDPDALGEHEVHVRKLLNMFLAASNYWTANGLAREPDYKNVQMPEDVKGIEDAYLPLVRAVFGDPNINLSAARHKDAPGQGTLWDETKHPRGQPENAGEFAPKKTAGGGAAQKKAPLDPAEDYKKNGTRAKAFKAWFGDWENDAENASKVVNAEGEPQETAHIDGAGSHVTRNGKPIAVYHGTPIADFDAFDKRKDSGENLYGPGFYFTEDVNLATEYASGQGTFYQTLSIPTDKRAAALKEFEDRAKEAGIALDNPDISWSWAKTKEMFIKHGMVNYLGSSIIGSDRWKLGMKVAVQYGAQSEIRRGKSKGQKSNIGIKECYLNVRKPFDADAPLSDEDIAKIAAQISKTTQKGDAPKYKMAPADIAAAMQSRHHNLGQYANAYRLLVDHLETWGNVKDGKKVVNAALQSLGYDGITHIGGHLMGGGHEHRVWIAWEPNQIKSVANKGTFDPSNDNINLSASFPEQHAEVNEHRQASDELAAKVIKRAEAAGYAVSTEVKRETISLMRRLQKSHSVGIKLLHEFMEGFKAILLKYEPALARVVSDARIAAFLQGGQGVVRSIRLEEIQHDPWMQLEARRSEPIDWMNLIYEPHDSKPILKFPIIEEAAKDLVKRGVLTEEYFRTVAGLSRLEGFTITRLCSLDALEKMRDGMTSAIVNGDSFKTFHEKAGEALDASGLSPARQEVLFRNHVNEAYARGQKAVSEHPLVRSVAVFAVRSEIDDSRLTDLCYCFSHSGLPDVHGKRTSVYYVGDPVWRLVAPISHRGCRCSTILLTVKRAAERGIAVAKKWLETGIRPGDDELFVPMPDLALAGVPASERHQFANWQSPWMDDSVQLSSGFDPAKHPHKGKGKGGGQFAPKGTAQSSQVTDPAARAKAFKAWFGKSKIVEKGGKPKRVYHGTSKAFDAFQKAAVGSGAGKDLADTESEAYFFTPDPEFASKYAHGMGLNSQDVEEDSPYPEGANVLPVYLKMEHPYVSLDMGMGHTPGDIKAAIDQAKADGCDGVILRRGETRKAPPSDDDVFIVFKPHQIKSATGNRGTFDPKQADMRLSGA